jgi:hypothetical protein
MEASWKLSDRVFRQTFDEPPSQPNEDNALDEEEMKKVTPVPSEVTNDSAAYRVADLTEDLFSLYKKVNGELGPKDENFAKWHFDCLVVQKFETIVTRGSSKAP